MTQQNGIPEENPFSANPAAQGPAVQYPGAEGQTSGTYAQQPYAAQQQAPGYYGQQDAVLSTLQSNGTTALILGILGIFLTGPLTSIPAWIIGSRTLTRARENGIPEELVKNAYYGKIVGMIGTILFIIAIVLVIIFFVFIAIVAMNDPSLSRY